MSLPDSAFIWIPVLFLGILVLVGGILAVAFRPRPQSGLGPRAGATAALPEGSWNASLHLGALGATTGTEGRFDVVDGHLSFTPATPGDPQWTLPCANLAVRAGSGLAPHPLTLRTPNGEIRCTVSRERINRFSDNTMKSARQTRYAREFAEVLLAHGARPM